LIKRQAITAKLAALLGAITTTGGAYKTTFPTVKVWSTNIEEQDADSVYCVLREVGNKIEGAAPVVETLTYEIALGCVKGTSNYSHITNMIDDVYKCLNNNLGTLRGLYGHIDLNLSGDSVDIQQFERQVAEAVITIEIVHKQNARWYYDATSYS